MTIRVKGLDEFRRELRRADKRFGKAVGQANKKVGARVVAKGAPAIRSLPSPGGNKAMSGLKSSAKQTKVVVALTAGNPTIRANVLGTLSHTVWGRRIPGSGPWQPWLGTSWQPEQLYGLGPAIKKVMDGFALDEYMDAVLDGLAKAFPD